MNCRIPLFSSLILIPIPNQPSHLRNLTSPPLKRPDLYLQTAVHSIPPHVSTLLALAVPLLSPIHPSPRLRASAYAYNRSPLTTKYPYPSITVLLSSPSRKNQPISTSQSRTELLVKGSVLRSEARDEDWLAGSLLSQ
jgi:hypothetical protein